MVVGWPFRRGVMAHMDLLVFDHVPTRSTWLSTADVPRRTAPFSLIHWLSRWISGVTLVRCWMVLIVASAFVGMVRVLRAVRLPIAIGAGLLWALNPLLLTRLGVGHLGLAVAISLLPWTLTALLEPTRSMGQIFLVGVAFGMCGYFGWWLSMPVLAVSLARPASWRRRTGALACAAAGHVWWVASALQTVGRVTEGATSQSFVPVTGNALGVLRLLVGHGFWQVPNQVGARHLGVAVIAIVLVALAVVGRSERPADVNGRLLAVAAIGLSVTLSPAVPGLRAVVHWVTDHPALAGLREGQRLLALFVLPLLIGAAHGVDRVVEIAGSRTGIGRRSMIAGSGFAVAAAVLVGSAWWGLDGRLDVRPVPRGWAVLGRLGVEQGALVALPWTQYYDVPLAGGARTHHPVPFVSSGDVIYSHDLGLRDGGSEGVDDREATVSRLVEELAAGRQVAALLGGLGVRWIAVDRRADPIVARSVGDLDGVVIESSDGDVLVVRILEWTELRRRSPSVAVPGILLVATVLAALATTFLRRSGRHRL